MIVLVVLLLLLVVGICWSLVVVVVVVLTGDLLAPSFIVRGGTFWDPTFVCLSADGELAAACNTESYIRHSLTRYLGSFIRYEWQISINKHLVI